MSDFDFFETLQRSIGGHLLSVMLDAARIETSLGLVSWYGQCETEDESTLVEEWLRACGYAFTCHPAVRGAMYMLQPQDKSQLIEIAGALRAILVWVYVQDILAQADFPRVVPEGEA